MTKKSLIPVLSLSLIPVALAANPFVTGTAQGVYATVTDPMLLSFAPDGTLYCGRDASGSGGAPGDAVRIHRIAPGGVPVTEFGDLAITDPDAVLVDVAGVVTGVPGTIIVGGVDSVGNQGKLSKIAPDGSVTTWFGPGTGLHNPSAFDFDQTGRLLFTENANGSVQVTTGETPTVLFTLAQANRLAVDALNRIVVTTTGGTHLRLYSSDGTLLNASFAPARVAPLTRGPGGAWGTDLYAVAQNGDLLRIDPDGNVAVVGGGFDTITDFKFGPDDALYASEHGADRVLRFAPPSVPGAVTTIHATVTDPVRLSFMPDGSLFVGRDNAGSGGDNRDAARIYQIGAGGAPVVEFSNTPISDPDGVFYDETGRFTGTPGAIMVGGVEETVTGGKLVKVLPDGSVALLYGPTATAFNPNLFVYDPVQDRLLFSDDQGGLIWEMTGTTPAPLFSLAQALPLAVDTQGRILAGSIGGTSLNLYEADGALITHDFAAVQNRTATATGPGGFWGTGVYAVDEAGWLISIATDGVVTRVGRNFGHLTDFAFGPDGALYASHFENDLIWRVSPGEPAPRLRIVWSGPDEATLSWLPDTPGFVLQETPGLSPANWTDSPSGPANPVNVSTMQPTKFYRLIKP